MERMTAREMAQFGERRPARYAPKLKTRQGLSAATPVHNRVTLDMVKYELVYTYKMFPYEADVLVKNHATSLGKWMQQCNARVVAERLWHRLMSERAAAQKRRS